MKNKLLIAILLFSANTFSVQSSAADGFNKFIECSKNEAMKYAPLSDSAESIAKTAVFSCSSLAYAYLKSDKSFELMSSTNQAEALDKLIATVEPVAMKTVLDFRLSRLK